MARPDLSSRSIAQFATAPAPGANAGALLRVGSALFYDNGTMLVPLDQQGDWAGRTIFASDTAIANDNVVYVNSAAATTFTIPASGTLRFPLNKLIDVLQVGSGACTLTPESSAVLLVGPGLATMGQGKALSLIQRALDVWQVLGGGASGSSTPQPRFKATIGDGSPNVVASISASGFNTVPLSLVVTAKNGFTTGSLAGNLVTIPVTGDYMVGGAFRISDSSSSRNLGIGVGPANADSPDFYWRQVGGVNRDTVQFDNLLVPFTAGQQARLFIYSDSADANVVNASMTLIKLPD